LTAKLHKLSIVFKRIIKFKTISLLRLILIKLSLRLQLKVILPAAIAAIERFQPFDVEHVSLNKIFNGKGNNFSSLGTLDLKEKPLKVRTGISIRS
jgi:hypothetical protein